MFMSASHNFRRAPSGLTGLLLASLAVLLLGCSGQTDVPANSAAISVVHANDGDYWLELQFQPETAEGVVAIEHAVIPDSANCSQDGGVFAQLSLPAQGVADIGPESAGEHHCFKISYAGGSVSFIGYHVQPEDIPRDTGFLTAVWQDIEEKRVALIADDELMTTPPVDQYSAEMEGFAADRITAVLDLLQQTDLDEEQGLYFVQYSDEIREHLSAVYWSSYIRGGSLDGEQAVIAADHLEQAIDRLERIKPPVFFG